MELKWNLFITILIWLTYCQSSQLQVVLNQHQGVYSKIMKFDLNENIEHLVVFPKLPSVNPYKIKTWSQNATTNNPVMVAVEQQQHIISWEVPSLVETTQRDRKLSFANTSKTLCYTIPELALSSPEGGQPKNFVIHLSTLSPNMVTISLQVKEVGRFYVRDNMTYSLSVSPSETKFVYYKFPKSNDTEIVRIEIDSGNDLCIMVSIQKDMCPVFDSDSGISYRGKYQTVSRKGALTINNAEFPTGFFLVFLAKVDNYICNQEILPSNFHYPLVMFNRTSQVDFRIVSIKYSEYFVPVLVTFILIATFYCVSFLMVRLFIKYGRISTIQPVTNNAFVRDPPHPPEEDHIEFLLKATSLHVHNLTMYPRRAHTKSLNYLWHILGIAIFYSIPVVQLVWTYQKTMNQSGNQDICYYNFRCSLPGLGFNDFNHVFSNIGYFFGGVLFLLVSLHRNSTIPRQPGFGIPIHYGLYYAMGIALIIEGILSACYHVCPSQSNFQFDTSFMYAIAVLCMIKLYQNRHPDVSAANYTTFIMLGITIFLAAIGILNGHLLVWVLFALIYSLLSVVISFKIYFLDHVLKGFKKLKQDYSAQGLTAETVTPLKRNRFIVLLIANVVNYVILITGLCLYDSQVTDFGTFLLGLLMANTILYTVFYSAMKIIHGERICIEAMCYFVLMLVSWCSSAYFFFDPAIHWTLTPAQSRLQNQDCILMNFYDKHDVWHLLSAPALYFSFMYLKCLDDDILDKKQEEIVVF